MEQDALLAELAGQPVRMESPDGPVNPTPEKDPLEVQRPEATATAVQKSDAKHSTAAGGKGYRVLVRGEYFAHSKDSNAKVRKNYELAFNLPSLDKALSIIVGKLLSPALRKKHEDYLNYRTHDIVDVKPLSPETPESNNLQYMPRPSLEAFVRENRVPLNPTDYPNVIHLRAAIVDFTLNPKGFEDREKVRQEERKQDAMLAALNPDLEVASK